MAARGIAPVASIVPVFRAAQTDARRTTTTAPSKVEVGQSPGDGDYHTACRARLLKSHYFVVRAPDMLLCLKPPTLGRDLPRRPELYMWFHSKVCAICCDSKCCC